MEKNLKEFNDAISQEVIDKINELSSYFDSIQIFATRHVDEKLGTTRFVYGTGNWYARYGLTKHWVDTQAFTFDETLKEDDDNNIE